jgi:prepilin-type N-terminal cleavage/methylation domain-containing protein
MDAMKVGTGGKAGFSLVEVTLALLVVAVGLTATLALFPEGLMATREAVNNTETALFADYVFSTLELSAAYQALDGNVTVGKLESGTDDFISEMFSRDADEKKFQLDASGKTATFYWMPDYYGLTSGDMDSDYFKGKLATAVFTYTLDLDLKEGNGSPFTAVLTVWPGEFEKNIEKSKMRLEDARIFYREILPPL